MFGIHAYILAIVGVCLCLACVVANLAALMAAVGHFQRK